MTMGDLLDKTDIPDDPEHWDRLAGRVATAAIRASRRGAFDWVANSRLAWVTTCVLIVGALTLMMRPVSKSPQGQVGIQWAEMLAPSDYLGQAIVMRDDPPAVGALLLSAQGERAR
jgi:hypothetical protein